MKSYYDIAINDFKYLELSMNLEEKFYNQMSIACQQIAEKLLKQIIVECYTGDNVESLFKTHNLKRLYYAVHESMPSFILDTKELANLTDFYFDAKYPGDDYIDVNKEMFEDCYYTMLEVKKAVERLIRP